MNIEQFSNKVYQSKADIIGIYIASPRYNDAKRAIEICRQMLPKAFIIAGGPHPSAIPTDTLIDIPQLDVCVVGEGEVTMLELIESFKKNSDLALIDGVAYRNKANGKIVFTKSREFIKNLDELPYPARELFPLKKYKVQPPLGRKKPYFSIITSRGCPFNCAFCSKAVFKNYYRTRSPKNVCDEIEYLINKYGAKEIHFYDDDFTLDMARAEKICDEILRRNLKFRWACSTRVDQVNEELLKKMKKAGCWHIMYGVESGSQKILNSINKGFTINQIIRAFEMTKKLGLQTFCSLIYGMPGETKETLKETFDLINKIKPDFLSGGHLRILPGSKIFEATSNGQFQGKVRALDKNENLVVGFFNKGDYLVFENSLSFKEIKMIAQKALRRFYLSPRYIGQALLSIRSIEDIKYYLVGGAEIIKLIFKK